MFKDSLLDEVDEIEEAVRQFDAYAGQTRLKVVPRRRRLSESAESLSLRMVPGDFGQQLVEYDVEVGSEDEDALTQEVGPATKPELQIISKCGGTEEYIQKLASLFDLET